MTQSPFLGAKRHVYTYLALKCSWFLSCIIRVIPNHNMGIPRYSITICCAIDIYDLWECEQPQPASQMRWRYQGDCERGAKRGIECVRGDAKGGMGLPLQNHRRLSEATWGQYDNEFNLIYGALVHHWVTMEQLPDMKSSQTIFGMTFVYEEKNEVFDGFCTREMFPSVVHVHAKTTTGENHGS